MIADSVLQMLLDRASRAEHVGFDAVEVSAGGVRELVAELRALRAAPPAAKGTPADATDCGCDEGRICERHRIEGHTCGEDGPYCDSDVHRALRCAACEGAAWIVVTDPDTKRLALTCSRCGAGVDWRVNDALRAALDRLRALASAPSPETALDPRDALLLDLWNQYAYPVAPALAGREGVAHDGGMSVLEDACSLLVARGLLVPVREDCDWYAPSPLSERTTTAADPTADEPAHAMEAPPHEPTRRCLWPMMHRDDPRDRCHCLCERPECVEKFAAPSPAASDPATNPGSSEGE
jgi:hypothetical protein